MRLKETDSKNIAWINTGRGICMLCVFIAHCNFYYLNHISPIYFVYKPFYLSFFFFLSGFLMFKDLSEFPFEKKLRSIANKLLWPVLFFPTLIWIPKALVHGKDVGVGTYLVDLLGGTAAWFVSTLIVAQIISIIAIYIFKNKWLLIIITAIISFFLAFYLAEIDSTPFPWYYKSGMIAFLFLVLGGITRNYYDEIKRFISCRNLIISAVIYLGIMLYNYYYLGWFQAIMSVKYDNIIFGLVCNLLGIIFMLQLCHYIPSMRWLQYIGKNSIIFYFFAGGVPLVVGYLAKMYIPYQGYVMTLLVTVLSVALIFPISYIINRYFSWTLDFSKITNKLSRQNKR